MLLTERHGKVLVLTLNRPAKRNALHPELVNALQQSLEEAASDNDLQVVVLTGAGPAFCAGLDLEHTLGKTPIPAGSKFGLVFDLFQRLYTLPQPVIAAINGPAIAGGFDLAQFCDLRLCVPDAVFSQAEINLGLTQMIYPLYKTVGIARAKEWALTGRLIIAEEAQHAGFINHIYPAAELLPQAMQLAAVLAAKPRQALFETKRLSRELLEMEGGAAFARMGEAIQERLQSNEHRDALQNHLVRLRGRK